MWTYSFVCLMTTLESISLFDVTTAAQVSSADDSNASTVNARLSLTSGTRAAKRRSMKWLG
jgi:hypothetical protein